MTSYLPLITPAAEPNADEQLFLDNCLRRVLAFQCCSRCHAFRHPPQPMCPRCQSMHFEWREAHGRTELYTFTIVHQALHPAVKECVPYNVAVVLFADCDNVRLLSNVVGVESAHLRIGMLLELVWESPAEGVVLPRFRPAAEAGT